MVPPALPASSGKPRSTFVPVLAWLMMILGVIGLPISLISALMVAAKSYGTQSGGVSGFITVVCGPAIMLVTGFGLLRRWRVAQMVVISLLSLGIIQNGWELARGSRPTITYTTPAGVKTTVIGSDSNFHSVPIIAVCAALITKLSSRGVRDEFQRPHLPSAPSPAADRPTVSEAPVERRHWRVGHRGRDMMYYEEEVNQRWERLDIDGEMLMGPAHHVIYFASRAQWEAYPEWPRHRRTEIIGRIKSEFRAPDYEYQGDAP